MVGEELSRRRILVWLQERRINSAEHFHVKMVEICDHDEDLTYLRVKKKLVATFGIQVFTEHKEVGRLVGARSGPSHPCAVSLRRCVECCRSLPAQ